MINPTEYDIAVLDGRTIRKFINKMKKIGSIISIDRPIHKRITKEDGYVIFSGLKYSNGWDCRISKEFTFYLKQCIK